MAWKTKSRNMTKAIININNMGQSKRHYSRVAATYVTINADNTSGSNFLLKPEWNDLSIVSFAKHFSRHEFYYAICLQSIALAISQEPQSMPSLHLKFINLESWKECPIKLIPRGFASPQELLESFRSDRNVHVTEGQGFGNIFSLHWAMKRIFQNESRMLPSGQNTQVKKRRMGLVCENWCQCKQKARIGRS